MTSTSSANGIAGSRVLVLEDEVAISLLLEDMLLDLGCEVVGPAARVAEALDLIGAGTIDYAILDVNVGRELSYPVADALAARGIPFLFSTGYGAAGLADGYKERPYLQKPFSQDELTRQMRRLAER